MWTNCSPGFGRYQAARLIAFYELGQEPPLPSEPEPKAVSQR